MNRKYAGIREHPYPFPAHRRRMSQQERAAQFSPFAALNGFEDAIQNTTMQFQSADDTVFSIPDPELCPEEARGYASYLQWES